MRRKLAILTKKKQMHGVFAEQNNKRGKMMTKKQKVTEEKVQVSMRIYPEIWSEYKRICSVKKKTTGDMLSEMVLSLINKESVRQVKRARELEEKYFKVSFEDVCKEEKLDPDDMREFLHYNEDNVDNPLSLDEDDVHELLDKDDEIRLF